MKFREKRGGRLQSLIEMSKTCRKHKKKQIQGKIGPTFGNGLGYFFAQWF